MVGIQFKDIRKSFGDVAVVHGISLDIRDGEFIRSWGRRAAAKSTLLRARWRASSRSRANSSSASAVINPEPRTATPEWCSRTMRSTARFGLRQQRHGLRSAGFPRTRSSVASTRPQKSASRPERAVLASSPAASASASPWAARSCEPSVFLFDEPLEPRRKLRVQTRLQIQKLHRRLKTTSLYVTHDQVEAMTLAHRMIVMNAGRAEQVGTPQEVYDDPETMFVANFIGSPPMNLVHGRVSADGSHFEHDSGVLSLPEPCTALAGRAVVLGVRPEHVTLRPEGGLAAFEVETVEALGADHLIHGVLLGQNVVFRVDNHMYIPEVGIRRAGLEFSAEHVYWFDPETTKRIRL